MRDRLKQGISAQIIEDLKMGRNGGISRYYQGYFSVPSALQIWAAALTLVIHYRVSMRIVKRRSVPTEKDTDPQIQY